MQARPQPGLLDGTDDYDYYYYGYVAPRGAEELYKKQEPVVYTIYYAEDSHGTAEAYRVYGSMGEERTPGMPAAPMEPLPGR